MAQNLHSNTQAGKEKKIWGHPDALNLLISEPYMKWSDDEIKEVMKKFLEYCIQSERGLTIEDFCWKNGIPTSTFENWHKKKPWVKKQKDIGLEIIAARRQDLAEFKEMDKELFIRHQHKYDPNYHADINEYWKRMKSDEQLQEAFKLFMSSMPQTGRVPSKEEKKKEYEAKRRIEANAE